MAQPENHRLFRTQRSLWAIVGACGIVFSGTVPSPVSARAGVNPAASRPVFEALILARIRAYGRGDFAAYSRLVAPDFVHISDVGGRRTLTQLEPYVRSGKSASATFAVHNLSFKVRGHLALVDCDVVATDALTSGDLREIDVFEPRGGHWVYLAHSETVMQVEDVKAVRLDSATLQQYAGRYRLPGGGIDFLSASGGKLMGSDAPEGEGTLLIPIAADTFVMGGDPSVTIFERNAQGRVTGYALRLGNGRVIRAIKM